MEGEGDVVVDLAGFAVIVPAPVQIAALDGGKILLQPGAVVGQVQPGKGHVGQHPEEPPVVGMHPAVVHAVQPGPHPVLFGVGEGVPQHRRRQAQGDGQGGHLAHLLFKVHDVAPVFGAFGVGAFHQAPAVQPAPVLDFRLHGLGQLGVVGPQQGAKPPQHPGPALHAGGLFAVGGAAAAHMEQRTPVGVEPAQRADHVQQKPDGILAAAQGIFGQSRCKQIHGDLLLQKKGRTPARSRGPPADHGERVVIP